MTTRTRHARDAREQLVAELPVTDRRQRLAGVSTAVLEGGDGPPIVLLHGPGESALWWMRVIPDLVTRRRVIVPDLPGHGESDASDDTVTAEGVLGWLEELLVETCPTPLTVVGHVLGGAIAARFASDHCHRLERLVLVDTLGLRRFRPSARFAFGLIRFLVRPTDRAYHSFLDQCMFDRDDLIERMGVDWEPFTTYHLDRSRTPSVKTAMRTLVKEVGTPPIPSQDLERIAVPTTLIWGQHDRAIRLEFAEEASARYGWPLHVIEDARDDPKLEQPEAFLEALYAALDGDSTLEKTP